MKNEKASSNFLNSRMNKKISTKSVLVIIGVLFSPVFIFLFDMFFCRGRISMFYGSFIIKFPILILTIYFTVRSVKLFQKEKNFILILRMLLVLVLCFFIFEVDESLVNNTINMTDKQCVSKSECKVELTKRLGVFECVNSDWNYYDSIFSKFSTKAFGIIILNSGPIYCTCEENSCKTHYVSDLGDEVTEESCRNMVDESEGDKCREFE